MNCPFSKRDVYKRQSVERVKRVYNLRDNPQTSYYPMEEFDEIFGKIWRGLRLSLIHIFSLENGVVVTRYGGYCEYGEFVVAYRQSDGKNEWMDIW